MKKILFSALLALVTLTSVFAQDKELLFTSTATGITFHVPANVKELQDDIEAVILQTPDELYTITAEAFDVEAASQDEITEHLATMAEAAGMDVKNAENISNETELITLIGLAADYDNGGAAVVAVAIVNGTSLGYYVTVVVGAKYVDYAVSSILTIGFDPDAVE